MNDAEFKAPWGLPLKVMTGAVVLFMGACAVLGVLLITRAADSLLPGWGLGRVPVIAGQIIAGAALLFIFGGALFSVRGYRISGNTLIIRRLIWNSRVSLAGFLTARADPDALKGSWRMLGNGGFFSFTGWYRNKALGTYRLFGTDIPRAVVLRIANRTIVVTPDDPRRFVDAVSNLAPA